MTFRAEIANSFNGPITVATEPSGRVALTVREGHEADGLVTAVAYLDEDQARRVATALLQAARASIMPRLDSPTIVVPGIDGHRHMMDGIGHLTCGCVMTVMPSSSNGDLFARSVLAAVGDREQLAQLIEALGTAYMGAPLERIEPHGDRALEQFTRETMAQCREAAKDGEGQ